MSVLSSNIENEAHQTKANSFPFLPVLLLLFLLSSVTYFAQNPIWQIDRLKIEEKNGGRNDKHANPDTQASAEQKYEEARAAWQKIEIKTQQNTSRKTVTATTRKASEALEKEKRLGRRKPFTKTQRELKWKVCSL